MVVVQLKQSLLSLHAITSPPAAAVGSDTAAAAAAGNPLDAVMSTNAVAQTKALLEQLRQEEAALQQRLAEIEAVQQYQQVRARPCFKIKLNVRNGLSCKHALHAECACTAQQILMLCTLRALQNKNTIEV